MGGAPERDVILLKAGRRVQSQVLFALDRNLNVVLKFARHFQDAPLAGQIIGHACFWHWNLKLRASSIGSDEKVFLG